MSRGEKIDVTRAEAVTRMLRMLCAVPVPPSGAPSDAGQRAIEYRLDNSGLLGGYSPSLGEPWSWSFGMRTPTTDCVGAVFGALGLDRRLQKWAFPEFSGDANCESVWQHANETKRVFRTLEASEVPITGDLALTPGYRGLLGRKPGHIEMVLRGPTKHNPKPLLCGNSPRHKAFGQGIGIGLPWSDKVVYVRYLGYKNDDYWRGDHALYTGKV